MNIKVIRILIPLAIVVLGTFYYIIAPAESSWAPPCLWKLVTGTDCPSCGIQRCAHFFLTGNFVDALLINPFLLIVLPYLILAILGKWYNINGVFDKLNRFLYSRKVLISYISLFFGWWIIRNILHV